MTLKLPAGALCALLLMVLFAAAPARSLEPPLTGSMTDDQGTVIKVTGFLKTLDQYPCVYQDSEMTIPLKSIKSLERLDGGLVLLTTRKGKQVKAVGEMDISLTEMIVYQGKNPVTGKTQVMKIDPLLVNRIVFD